jgi:antitoxin (DNA-binding transcriptional repressor) of toxin-antitoxin stability system
MQQVNLDQAQSQLEHLIDAALKGETVVIAKDDQQGVRLVPVSCSKRRQFGSAKGLILMADDFDDELADLSEYMP